MIYVRGDIWDICCNLQLAQQNSEVLKQQYLKNVRIICTLNKFVHTSIVNFFYHIFEEKIFVICNKTLFDVFLPICPSLKTFLIG